MSLRDVTLCVKHTSLFASRRRKLSTLLRSLKVYYGGTLLRILVACEQGRQQSLRKALKAHPSAQHLVLPVDAGLSAGRNVLVQAVRTPFLVMVDDDVIFHDGSVLQSMLAELQSDTRLALVGGCYQRADGEQTDDCFNLRFLPSADGGIVHAERVHVSEQGKSSRLCHRVHLTHNFFMARTRVLQQLQWDARQRVMEHETFFYQLYLNSQRVKACPFATVIHNRTSSGTTDKYRERSLRAPSGSGKSDAGAPFLQYLCKNLPEVRRFITPYVWWNCVARTYCRPNYDAEFAFDGRVCEPFPWDENDDESAVVRPLVSPYAPTWLFPHAFAEAGESAIADSVSEERAASPATRVSPASPTQSPAQVATPRATASASRSPLKASSSSPSPSPSSPSSPSPSSSQPGLSFIPLRPQAAPRRVPLLVLIFTRHANVARRAELRRSWLHFDWHRNRADDRAVPWRYVFVRGSEAGRYPTRIDNRAEAFTGQGRSGQMGEKVSTAAVGRELGDAHADADGRGGATAILSARTSARESASTGKGRVRGAGAPVRSGGSGVGSGAEVRVDAGAGADVGVSKGASASASALVDAGRGVRLDVVLGDTVVLSRAREGYTSLVHKTVEALRWALRVAHFDAVLKTDDDAVVHVGRLWRWLAETAAAAPAKLEAKAAAAKLEAEAAAAKLEAEAAAAAGTGGAVGRKSGTSAGALYLTQKERQHGGVEKRQDGSEGIDKGGKTHEDGGRKGNSGRDGHGDSDGDNAAGNGDGGAGDSNDYDDDSGRLRLGSFYAGRVVQNSRVVRPEFTRRDLGADAAWYPSNFLAWAVERTVYPPAMYLPYCSGGGYVLSAQTAAALLIASDARPRSHVIPVEDAYFGVLANESHVAPTPMPGVVDLLLDAAHTQTWNPGSEGERAFGNRFFADMLVVHRVAHPRQFLRWLMVSNRSAATWTRAEAMARWDCVACETDHWDG